MRPRKQGLGYRIWNQTRLAMHVDSYLQIYQELHGNNSREGWPASVGAVLSTTYHVLFQSILINLDMINDKSKGSVSLYRLLSEAKEEQFVTDAEYASLKSRLDRHATVLSNIGRQRNNLIAHRSEKQSFAKIKADYPIATPDLVALARDYYEVAKELHHKVPFNTAWELNDLRTGTREIIGALDAKYAGLVRAGMA